MCERYSWPTFLLLYGGVSLFNLAILLGVGRMAFHSGSKIYFYFFPLFNIIRDESYNLCLPSPEIKGPIKSIIFVTIKSIFYWGNPILKILLLWAPAQGAISLVISPKAQVIAWHTDSDGWMDEQMNGWMVSPCMRLLWSIWALTKFEKLRVDAESLLYFPEALFPNYSVPLRLPKKHI